MLLDQTLLVTAPNASDRNDASSLDSVHRERFEPCPLVILRVHGTATLIFTNENFAVDYRLTGLVGISVD